MRVLAYRIQAAAFGDLDRTILRRLRDDALELRRVGATLAELIAPTGWLPHTMRAALSGLLKRGYAVGIDRADKARGSVYRIEPTEMGGDSAAAHVEAAPTSETPRDRPERAVSDSGKRDRRLSHRLQRPRRQPSDHAP